MGKPTGFREYLREVPADRPPLEGTGAHGWDPGIAAMHALFIARGPAIPRGRVIGAFENVDVYPFITELLGLRPAPNLDGKPWRLRRLIDGRR